MPDRRWAVLQHVQTRALRLQSLLALVGLGYSGCAIATFWAFRYCVDLLSHRTDLGFTVFFYLVQTPYICLLALVYLITYAARCFGAGPYFDQLVGAARVTLRAGQVLSRVSDEGFQQVLASEIVRAAPFAAPLLQGRRALAERLELVAVFFQPLRDAEFYPERLTLLGCLLPLSTLWVNSVLEPRPQPPASERGILFWLQRTLLAPVRWLGYAAAALLAAPLGLNVLQTQAVLKAMLTELAVAGDRQRQPGATLD